MRTSLLYLFLTLFIFACNGDNEMDINHVPTEAPGYVFKSFETKISYCIGFDNGFTVNQVYNGPNTSDKFFSSDIEAGMVDYLGDGDLRIGIFQTRYFEE